MTHTDVVYHGNGARMDVIGNGEVDIIVTSPPYFPDDLENLIAVPREKQDNISRVELEILSFARSLRPVFVEMARILKPGRALVIQTKDIRYGEFLVPLADAHVSVATSCGFHLVTRLTWVPSRSTARRIPSFLTSKRVGSFRTYEGENFVVLAGDGGLERRGRVSVDGEYLREMARPVWRVPFRRKKDDHPYASPRPVIKDLLTLLTEEGDLVVDPFAGYGTILEVAKAMRRRVVGWDTDAACVTEANRRLA